MSELQKLINDNKHLFEINKKELDKRIEFAIATYDKTTPPSNLASPQHARLKKYYTNLQAMLIDSTTKLADGCKLDTANTKQSGAGFTVTFLKSDIEQTKDKVTLKKQIKADYLAELEENKQVWVNSLTAKLAKEAEADAVAQAQNKTRLIQDELSALLSSK
jgi:hypothetical protein